MQDKAFAEQKLRYAILVADQLLEGDWPHRETADALRIVRQQFAEQLAVVLSLDEGSSKSLVKAHCQNARHTIHRFIGFMGFMLRSTNLRNSFEIYHPISSLVSKIIDPDLRLIISSEWNYSPFTYPLPIEKLNDYMFVGLPASEAQNALIAPIAGHEIGHALWRRTSIGREIQGGIRGLTVEIYRSRWGEVKSNFHVELDQIERDLDAISVWQKSFTLASRQSEEIFCDLVALWIFGPSFAHAFRYLLAPDIGARPSGFYPTNFFRAQCLERAAAAYGDAIDLPSAEIFVASDEKDDVFLQIADEVTARTVDTIIAKVRDLCASKDLIRPTIEGKTAALSRFQDMKPVEHFATAADVLNAAWELRVDLRNWNVPGVQDDRKMDILNDLVLKSFEVDEWRRRLS